MSVGVTDSIAYVRSYLVYSSLYYDGDDVITAAVYFFVVAFVVVAAAAVLLCCCLLTLCRYSSEWADRLLILIGQTEGSPKSFIFFTYLLLMFTLL